MAEIDELLHGMPTPDFRERLAGALRSRAVAIVPTHRFDGSRVGVLADTHCTEPGHLPDAAMEHLTNVDLIIHCGDIGTPALLDRLREAAPVFAVRSPIDGPPDGAVLFDGPRMLRLGGSLMGVAFHLDEEHLTDGASDVFGVPVDVVVSGTTHVGNVARVGDLLALDPGSPTLPALGTPTIGIVDLGGERPMAELIELPKEDT